MYAAGWCGWRVVGEVLLSANVCCGSARARQRSGIGVCRGDARRCPVQGLVMLAFRVCVAARDENVLRGNCSGLATPWTCVGGYLLRPWDSTSLYDTVQLLLRHLYQLVRLILPSHPQATRRRVDWRLRLAPGEPSTSCRAAQPRSKGSFALPTNT
jgi:hypothetical protein